MIAALGGLGIVGIIVLVVVVLAILFLVRRWHDRPCGCALSCFSAV